MSVLKIATYSLNTRWFTAVMATIMIAAISHMYGYKVITPYFFSASLAILFSVVVFKAVQTVLFSKEALEEMLNPGKTLYFFTIVGAVNFIGICFSRVFHLHTTATLCWYVAIGLWLAVSLFSFSILFLNRKSEDRKIDDILHGGWFFATVGTQSTALLGVIVAAHAIWHVLFIQVFSFALWSVGASLYLIFMSLIILRLVFYRFDNNTDLSPYWMNAGAAAVTAITGTVLYQHIQAVGGPFVDFLPFLKGISLLFWSFGLWWMPFLIILAMRKLIYSDGGLAFTVGYWEIVFAVGLYADSTVQMVGLFDGQYLTIIAMCFSIACIILWCFSSIFTIVHLVRSSLWVPVNDLTIHYVIPYSFKLHGRLFQVKEVLNEWLDQTMEGVLKKRYCITTNTNLTCIISYDMLAKKWYFDQVKD
ncbi:MAG: tellurite resistance/C4-dicarboxylate transporter family protein [Candidatus Brocadia sp.]|jgi:tellurite resistance protein TehA-like permease